MADNQRWNHEYFDGSETIAVKEIIYLAQLTQQECDDIAVGPQEQFLLKIDDINTELLRYGINSIDVTPKWNWKPGTYDKVKEYIYKKLDLHKKAKNCDSLLLRTRDKVNYLSYINRQFATLETERYGLKQLGVSKEIDIDVFKNDCSAFVDKIITECNKIKELTNNSIIMKPYIKLNGRYCIYYLNIILSNLEMEVFSGRDINGKLIQKISLEPIEIKVKMNLRHILSNTRQCATLRGKYLSDRHAFPYISQGSRYATGEMYSTVCTDKHTEDIQKALQTSNYVALGMSLMGWAQYYHTDYSNPYNQPYRLHIGLSEEMSKEYQLIHDKISIINNCSDTMNAFHKGRWWNKDNSIATECNANKCSLKKDCSLFISILEKRAKFLIRHDEIEGIVGTIIEYMTDNSLCDTDIASQIEALTGYTLYNPTLEKITDSLTYYYSIRQALYESYLIDWHMKYNNFKYDDDIETTIDDNKIEEVMKLWVQSQEGE